MAVARLPAARAYAEHYLRQQVMSSLQSQREVAGSRLHILVALATELVLPVALVALGAMGAQAWRRSPATRWRRWAAASRRAAAPTARFRRWAAASRRASVPTKRWLALAGAGSLPLLLSPKQHRWYLLPALPFYALALAHGSRQLAVALQRAAGRATPRLGWAGAGALLLVGAASCAIAAAQPGRDADFHHDLQPPPGATGPWPPAPGSVLRTCDGRTWEDWRLHANLMRFYGLSLAPPAAVGAAVSADSPAPTPGAPAPPAARGAPGAAPTPGALLVTQRGASCAHAAGCTPLLPAAPRAYQVWACGAPAPAAYCASSDSK